MICRYEDTIQTIVQRQVEEVSEVLATAEGHRERGATFNTNKRIEVRRSRSTDTFELKQEDALEVWYSHGRMKNEAVSFALKNSIISYTVTIDGEPCVIFGVNSRGLISDSGIVWMLSSDRIKEIEYRFARRSREHIDNFLSIYPVLWNYCFLDNKRTLAWLASIGAKFDEPKPYGLHQKMFVRFEFRR